MKRGQIELTPTQRDILLHTLGLNYDPPHDRNRYCVHIGAGDSDTLADLRALVEVGLMAEGRKINGDRDQLFYATCAGIVLARTLVAPKKKRTRGQERYARYLVVSDAIPMTFGEFLKNEKDYR